MFWIIGSLVMAGLCVYYFIFLQASGFGAGCQWLWLVIAFAFIMGGIMISKHKMIWEMLRNLLGVKISTILAAAAILMMSCFIILESFIIAGSIGKQEYERLDYLIVLGAKLRSNGPSLVLKERLDTAIDYYTQNPDVMLIVSGGKGDDEPMTEAEGMKDYLLSHGIPETQIIMEASSIDTKENIKNSFELINEPSSYKTGIVSSNFHVFRAKLIAKRLGYSVTGLSAHTPDYLYPHYCLREAGALIYDIKNIL